MISIEALDPEFRKKLEQLRFNCLKSGINLKLKRGFVNVFEHAEMWRNVHQDGQIDKAISDLQHDKCYFLAGTLLHCGKMQGADRVKRLPGFSWHNWGKAVDIELYLKDSNKRIDHSLKDPYFSKFLDILDSLGLKCNQDACDFDGLHIQTEEENSPLDLYEPCAIDQEIYRSYKDGRN